MHDLVVLWTIHHTTRKISVAADKNRPFKVAASGDHWRARDREPRAAREALPLVAGAGANLLAPRFCAVAPARSPSFSVNYSLHSHT